MVRYPYVAGILADTRSIRDDMGHVVLFVHAVEEMRIRSCKEDSRYINRFVAHGDICLDHSKSIEKITAFDSEPSNCNLRTVVAN